MGGIRGMLSRGRAFALRQHQFCDKPLAVRSPVLLGTSLVIILCLGHVPIQVRRTASGCWLRVQRDHGIMRRTSTVGTCEPVSALLASKLAVLVPVPVIMCGPNFDNTSDCADCGGSLAACAPSRMCWHRSLQYPATSTVPTYRPT